MSHLLKLLPNTLSYIIISVIIFLICIIPFLLDLPIALFALVGSAFILFLFLANAFKPKYSHIILAVLFISIIAPPINISSNLPLIRIDEFIIYGFFPIILLFNFRFFKLDTHAKKFVRIYTLFMFCVILSTLFGRTILGVSISIRDIFEFITITKYLLIFLTIYTFTPDLSVKNFLYFVLFTIILSGFIGFLFYVGVLGLDSTIAPFYLQERIHIVNERLNGTFKNPNTFGAILVTGHLIALGLFFFETSKRKKLLHLFSILILAIFLFFAGSRTMIATYFLVTIVMIFIVSYTTSLNKKQILVLISVLCIGLIVSISFISIEIVTRLQSGLDLTNDQSLAMRFLAWYLNFQIFLESPIFGWGPAKSMFTTIVDNEFILILRRYGITGLLIFSGIYLQPLNVSFKQLKNGNTNIKLFSSIIFCVTITYLIAGLTNSLFHDNQTMDFWFVFLSFYYLSINMSQKISSFNLLD